MTKSILIIDDNKTDRYILKRLIRQAGFNYKVFEESDGETGIQFFKNFQENKEKHFNKYPPDFIFLDINMPIKNGFEFLKEFNEIRKEVTEINSTVISMFTSSDFPEDIRKANNYPFVKGYIKKIPNVEEIQKILNSQDTIDPDDI